VNKKPVKVATIMLERKATVLSTFLVGFRIKIAEIKNVRGKYIKSVNKLRYELLTETETTVSNTQAKRKNINVKKIGIFCAMVIFLRKIILISPIPIELIVIKRNTKKPDVSMTQ